MDCKSLNKIGAESPWMNKLNVWWWRKYVHSFQVAPLKSLINCEGGKSQFPVEKPGSTVLITRSQRRRPAIRHIEIVERERAHSLTPATSLTNIRQQRTDPYWRALYKINGLQPLKISRSGKSREVWDTVSDGIGYFSIQTITETIGKAED